MNYEVVNIGARAVLFVMAAEPEYGPHLRQRIAPLMTGVGPVEAAVELTHALTLLQDSPLKPDLVISLGSAGSRKLEQTKVYQVSSVSYRDMDASPLGFEKGRTPFLKYPVKIELRASIPTCRVPRYRRAAISFLAPHTT